MVSVLREDNPTRGAFSTKPLDFMLYTITEQKVIEKVEV